MRVFSFDCAVYSLVHLSVLPFIHPSAKESFFVCFFLFIYLLCKYLLAKVVVLAEGSLC